MRTINTNPEQFPNPHVFNPDRYIEEDGCIKRDFKLMPFQSGKRQCPGEPLAWAMLFVTTTSLLQKFVFLPVPGDSYSFGRQMQSMYSIGVQNYRVRARRRTEVEE